MWRSLCVQEAQSTSPKKRRILSQYGDYSIFLLGLAPVYLSNQHIIHPLFLILILMLDRHITANVSPVSLVLTDSPIVRVKVTATALPRYTAICTARISLYILLSSIYSVVQYKNNNWIYFLCPNSTGYEPGVTLCIPLYSSFCPPSITLQAFCILHFDHRFAFCSPWASCLLSYHQNSQSLRLFVWRTWFQQILACEPLKLKRHSQSMEP